MIHKQPQRHPLAIALVAAIASACAFPALAQDPAADKKEEAKTLDTLVVTAVTTPRPRRPGPHTPRPHSPEKDA